MILLVVALIVFFVALVVFFAGASLVHLITHDSLFDGLRERWKVHFHWRTEQTLGRALARYPLADIATAKYLAEAARNGQHRRADDMTPAELRYALLHEIGDRSEAEAPQPFWVRGRRRDSARPWSAVSAKLIRINGYTKFIECPWCVSFWVFLALWLLVWIVVPGLPSGIAGVSLGWWVVPLALAYRWIYAAIASRFE